MRNLFIIGTLVLLVSTNISFGQQPRDVERPINISNGQQGRMTVTEYGDAREIIASIPHPNPDRKIMGYRVRIFFDNSQNARQGATSTLNRFRDMYPDIPAYMTYENPYFKVSVGNCLTAEEAIILWGNIKGIFDKAFVTREEMSLSAIVN